MIHSEKNLNIKHGGKMKIIPLVSNKIRIEFENGDAIEIYESPTWNGIKIQGGKRLEKWIGRHFYKIMPAGGGEK